MRKAKRTEAPAPGEVSPDGGHNAATEFNDDAVPHALSVSMGLQNRAQMKEAEPLLVHERVPPDRVFFDVEPSYGWRVRTVVQRHLAGSNCTQAPQI
jgi:hypothetical protein